VDAAWELVTQQLHSALELGDEQQPCRITYSSIERCPPLVDREAGAQSD
jgi:hypothetical protein